MRNSVQIFTARETALFLAMRNDNILKLQVHNILQSYSKIYNRHCRNQDNKS